MSSWMSPRSCHRLTGVNLSLRDDGKSENGEYCSFRKDILFCYGAAFGIHGKKRRDLGKKRVLSDGKNACIMNYATGSRQGKQKHPKR